LTTVLAEASKISISSWSFRPSTNFRASVRAFSKRVGASSVLCMEADASSITTRRPLVVPLPVKKGRLNARIARINSNNCRKSSQFLRNFWNGAFACASARNRCHSSVLETNLTTRLRLSK